MPASSPPAQNQGVLIPKAQSPLVFSLDLGNTNITLKVIIKIFKSVLKHTGNQGRCAQIVVIQLKRGKIVLRENGAERSVII